MVIYLTVIFWLIIVFKKLCFWVWLWQLKEYRIKRFIDYFRTEKGKKLIINKLFLIKLLIFSGAMFFLPILAFLIPLIFLIETLFVVRRFWQKTLIVPVLTLKTGIILFIGALLVLFYLIGMLVILFWQNVLFLPGLYFAYFYLYLLVFDLLTPIIFSGLVLVFQPLTLILRNRMIKKAKQKRAKFKDLIVVGITGSYGKTSTKEFLFSILSEKFKVLKTKEHQNTDPALAQHILNKLNPEHQIFIAEIAAYSRGEVKSACDIVKPKIGILCGVNEQHLALFGSMENLMSAEGGIELIESLPKDGGVIILNKRKDLRVNHLKSRIFCSVKEKLDFWAEDIKVEKDYLFFKICSKKEGPVLFKVNLVGAQNVENVLLAAACAKELGMNLDEIAKACEKIKPLEKTMQIKKGINGLVIVDDSYSANPDGVIAALDYLKILPSTNKKIIIMPCLIELGPAAQKVHQKIGEKIGQVCDLAIITTKEMFEEIKKAALETGLNEKNILFMENPKEIFAKIKSFSRSGDAILLEGRLPAELIRQIII